MKLETIYLKANTPFSKAIEAWCSANANEVVQTKERYELSIENFDSLLITGGIHRKEISKLSIKNVLQNYEAKIDYFQKELKW